MGSYLNPGSERFQNSLRSRIYIDKSLLIEQVNSLVRTEQKYVCVSRPRRFGKSMAADMLSAYYGQDDAASLFDDLKIAKAVSYKEHLNQYNVIKVNMQEFLSATSSVDEMLQFLQKRILLDLKKEYPEFIDEEYLIWFMKDIFETTKRPFVILIDEWDCIFREHRFSAEEQKKYLMFLRAWLKDQDYVALAYITGILPVKKCGTQASLDMFTEYSMTGVGELASFFGFTEEEVRDLCIEYNMSFEKMREWYDGYDLIEGSRYGDIHYSMYRPESVIEAMLRHKFGTYWNQTEKYEALDVYLQKDIAGLKDAIIKLLAGERVEINTGTFLNDMSTFIIKDDVLTLLVHLGYLSYRWDDKTVCIPNKEVLQEYENAIRTMNTYVIEKIEV